MHANRREEADRDRSRADRGDGRAQEHVHRRHALRRGQADRPRGDQVPGAGHRRRHRTEDEGRPGAHGRRARRGWSKKTRRSTPATTRRPARRSSPAWASCTSRSSSTACCASSTCRRTSAGRRSPTKRRSRQPADAEGRFVRQSGGRGQFGVVKLHVEPLPRGTGFVFENKIIGGSIPKEYINPIGAGHQGGAGDRRSRQISRDRRQGAACRWVSITL